MGGGEDAAQLALLRDTALLHGLERAVGRGAAVLAVCAGMQVLGREFGGSDGRPHTGIGLLDCTTDRLEERAVGEMRGRSHRRRRWAQRRAARRRSR